MFSTIAKLNKIKKKNIVKYQHELEIKIKPQIVQAEDLFTVGLFCWNLFFEFFIRVIFINSLESLDYIWIERTK